MKQPKLITFDLDDTLCPLGKGVTPENVARLRELERRGTRIAICSGKPTYYLCGFLRQLELERPVLVGENGAVIQLGVELPPKEFYCLPYSENARKSIAFLKNAFDSALPGIWYQPNLVGLTPFLKNAAEFDLIQSIVEENRDQIADINIYRHVDCFDFTPVGIDKYTGMAYLGRLLGIAADETIAVGNGVNDYPMFRYAGYALGVKVPDPEQVNRNFDCIEDALDHLLSLFL